MITESEYLHFRDTLNVSRETFLTFIQYRDLLLKWQKTINLVAPSTLDDILTRHILDSAQLKKLLPDPTARLVDLGSGAGFPGMVLAMMGMTDVHLVESDKRKCIFLQNVSRETLTPVTIHTTRIETLSKITFDLVVARALAPLSDLISHAFPLLQQEESGKNLGVCHFLKGQNYRTEIEEAQKHWEFDHHITPSMSSQNGVIITITNVRHA